ncbi:MAG: flagellar hook-basal body protein [Vicinamibacterales bacterium]
MSGGAYLALSGVRTRIAQLDRIAADLANATTAGYKGERASTVSAERPGTPFGAALDAAIDVTDGPTRVDFRSGPLTATGNDFDAAIDGDGFFEIETARGLRYTRNGHFSRGAGGKLVTADGSIVRGESGDAIELPAGQSVTYESDGTVRAGGAVVGKLHIVDFQDRSRLVREGGAFFAVPEGMTPEPVTDPVIRGGTLEGSNVSVVESMVRLVDVSRTFDALQRGIGVVMNDLGTKAISELGRR